MSARDLFIALFVVTVWGCNFYFMKRALMEMNPWLMGFLRFGLLLFPALFIFKRPKVSWTLLILYGITMGFGQMAFMFLGMAYGMPSGLSSLLMQSQIFFTVLLVAVIWKEKLQINQSIALFFAFLGLVLVGIGQYKGSLPLFAMFLVLLGGLCWALGNLMVKKIGVVNALSLTVWGNVPTFILFGFISIRRPDFAQTIQELSAFSWVSLSFQAYGSSLLGYGLWGGLIAKYPAGKIAPLGLLAPIIALLISGFFLKEALNFWHYLGISVIIFALMTHLFWRKR